MGFYDQHGNYKTDLPDLRSDERKQIDAGWAEARRLRIALDKITKHPDCHRLVMQIACEALERKTDEPDR